VRDLAFVVKEQPAAGDDPLQFLSVERRFDEDAATDQAVVGIRHSCGSMAVDYLLLRLQ